MRKNLYHKRKKMRPLPRFARDFGKWLVRPNPLFEKLMEREEFSGGTHIQENLIYGKQEPWDGYET